MVVLNDHDMIDVGHPNEDVQNMQNVDEGSNSRLQEEEDIGLGSIPIDVHNLAECSNTRDQEDIDASDDESDRHDPDFRPSPNGTPYWVPDLEDHEKPQLDHVFDSFQDAYNMYKAYADKGRFSIRISGQKKVKGVVTHKYIWCNKAGKAKGKFDINTLNACTNEDQEKVDKSKKTRKTVTRVTNCPARICLKPIKGTNSFKLHDFVENHNHPLLNENNKDLSKTRRQLNFGDYLFIHRASLANIGPSIAHRLKVALMGGFDKVRGTSGDYRNYRRLVNLFIGDRDAQMIVDKLVKRQKHVPEFSFVHHVRKDELVRMFWADETMKVNYAVFGDVVAFDATFRTNKYDYVFVPFTGVDHNQKCVTFGAALLSDESEDSYKWMLSSFLQVHGKQPPLALTDQDAALRNAVVKIFPDSKHRLCMWHITQKLPGKVLGDLATDSEFRKDFHKLVWNVYIEPSEFEKRWDSLIEKYNLQGNKWLSKMYRIRDRWIPGYFKDYPMCGLMKTTSRSESSNAFFQIYSHRGNTFVQFMLCFESAMEKQRYSQRVLDNTSNDSTPSVITNLPIEKHASLVYTHSIFREVQQEIYKGLYACSQTSSQSDGNVETCIIQQTDKRSMPVIFAKVILNHTDGSLSCSCGHYTRHGYLCRHIFCLLCRLNIDKIPEKYIIRRWTKKALPAHLLEKKHRYGPCIEECDQIAAEVHATIEDCVGILRSNTDRLTEFLNTVKDMKKKLEAEMLTPNDQQSKEAIFADLLGVTVPPEVTINIPQQKSSNKGSKRKKSAAEIGSAAKKQRTTRKRPYKKKRCSKCGVLGHFRTTCTWKEGDPLPDFESVNEVAEVQEVESENEVVDQDLLPAIDEDYESEAEYESDEDTSSDEYSSSDED